MNIQIFTYYYTNNYGAQLQSMALKEFLEENFQANVNYSRYQPKNLMFREVYGPLFTKNPLNLYKGLRRMYNFHRWKQKVAKLKSAINYVKINKKKEISIYGSDEIWNFTNPYFGFSSHFFGESNEGIKIAYATSIGKSNLTDLDKKKMTTIHKLLESYYSISVRDLNTANFVKKITGFEPPIVVDPVLLFTPKLFMSPVPRKIDSLKKFAIVYGTVFSNNEKKNILDFCKKKNLLLISLGYRNKWVNNNITYVDPTQFIQFLKKAEIVFTSMFHGVMLSFKLKKQFWCIIDPIRRNKLSFFLDHLKLSSRIISDFSNFENKLDYSDREKKYSDWVVSSKEYLIDSINQSRFLKENK